MPKPELIQLDATFYQDPEALYERLRADGPLHRVRTPEGQTGWLATDYDVAKDLLADPRVRKDARQLAKVIERSQPGTFSAAAAATDVSRHMLNMDPPDHMRLRRLVAKAFTTKEVGGLVPRIERIADDLIDAMRQTMDPVDLLSAYAFPLPMTVICELLGIPVEDRDSFQAWTNTLVSDSTIEEVRTASAAMAGYLADLVTDCRVAPRPGLLSALVAARDGGDALDDQEVVSMSFLLLIGGHETIVNLIGNTMLTLLGDPSRLASLRSEPERIPAAVEEHLRHLGPVHLATLRFTSEPITHSGTRIEAEELLFISLTAANRDSGRFSEPHRLDYERDEGGHLAFGHGIHYCIGAPLARAEARIALEKLLAAFPDIALAADREELQWRPSSRIRGLRSLPVSLA